MGTKKAAGFVCSPCIKNAFGAVAVTCLLLSSVITVAQADDDIDTAASLVEILLDADPPAARDTLAALAKQLQTGELSEQQAADLRTRLGEPLARVMGDAKHPAAFEASVLAATWGDASAIKASRGVLVAANETDAHRTAALNALLAAKDEQAVQFAGQLLGEKNASDALRGAVLAALGKSDSPAVATAVLQHYAAFDPDLQPKAIELLTQRASWSKALLAAIGEKQIAASVINANQVARLQGTSDPELKQLVQATWGTLRTERNPQRELVVQQMRTHLQQYAGDANRGAAVFQKVCGQCHKIYGQGQEVGPDITSNGRASFEQLLSNVFDPSLVIGAAYQARQVATDDGRILTGLVTEENDQRLVLKLQGGKVETIPRDEIEEMKISPLSLMPEGLENQLKPDEISDLFAFLTLDRAPDDADAKLLPGTPNVRAP